MSFVITRLCRDCVDGSCIPVCPVLDCIVEHRPAGRESELPRQLFINPNTCTDCGACEPECPWEAIAHEDDVPAAFASDTALNALVASRESEFVGAAERSSRRPTDEEVQANKERWENEAAKGGEPAR
jgi:formate hydrogenlyase subunit 6/NADH:ubiquinone oxidoreductase subunit I